VIYLLQAALAILIALWFSWHAIPEKSAAAWVIPAITALGVAAWGLVFWGDTGTLTKYVWAYQVQTSAFFAAGLGSAVCAAYVWYYYSGRDALGPLGVAVDLTGDVVANVLYRTTEFVGAFQVLLQQSVHVWHLVGFALALAGATRRSNER